MALIKCHECGAKISDAAPTCPKCGVPAVRRPPPQPEKARPWGTIAAVAIAGTVAVVAVSDPNGSSAPAPSGNPGATAKAWSPSKEDIAKQPQRRKVMQKLDSAWSKYESCNSIDLCVYVRPDFFRLEIDKKEQLAQLFWTWHAVEMKSDVVAIRLHDSRSGKYVGRYERQRLTML